MHGFGEVIAALCLIQRTWMPLWNEIFIRMLVFLAVISLSCFSLLADIDDFFLLCVFSSPSTVISFPLNQSISAFTPGSGGILFDKPRCLNCIQTLFLWRKLKPVSAGAEGTKEFEWEWYLFRWAEWLLPGVRWSLFYALAFFAPLA